MMIPSNAGGQQVYQYQVKGNQISLYFFLTKFSRKLNSASRILISKIKLHRSNYIKYIAIYHYMFAPKKNLDCQFFKMTALFEWNLFCIISNHPSSDSDFKAFFIQILIQLLLDYNFFRKQMLKQENQQVQSQNQDHLESMNDQIIQKQGDSIENIGKWNYYQNIKYVIFLDFYKAQLSSKKKRRDSKMFNLISRFVMSRTPLQCRSHHQKLQNKYKNLKSLINAQKEEIGANEYYNIYQEMKPELIDFDFDGKEQKIKTSQIAIQTDITWAEQKTIPSIPRQPQVVQYPILWLYPQMAQPYGYSFFFE